MSWTPEKRAAAAEKARAQQAARARHRCEVPAWVIAAGLAKDFKDVADLEGEFAAASYCRRLTAAARRERR